MGRSAAPAHHRVVILGAGAAGLATCKEILAHGETSVRVFDDRDGIGGLWRFNENAGGVMKSTTTTSSRQYLAFSDFRFPKELPHFIHNTDYMDYLNEYVAHFKLAPYLQFNSKASKTEFKDGVWTVWTEKGGTTPVATCDYLVVASGLHSSPDKANWLKGKDSFKGRIVHASNFKYLEELKGKKTLVIGIGESGADVVAGSAKNSDETTVSIRRGVIVLPHMTTSGYPADFDATRAKTMLPRMFLHDLNGMLPSAFSFCYATAYTLFSPIMLTYWLLTGQLSKAMGVPVHALTPITTPLSMFFNAITGRQKVLGMAGRFTSKATVDKKGAVDIKFKIPDPQVFAVLFSWQTFKAFLFGPKRIYDSENGVGLKRDVAAAVKRGCTWSELRTLFAHYSQALSNVQPFTKSPYFLDDIAAGRVTVQCGIDSLTPTGAKFVDGSAGEYDTVILCTGYYTELPYLPTDKLRKMEGTELYKHIFDLDHPLAFVGFARPNNGAMPPIAEMQARVLAGHLTGSIKLPSPSAMKATMMKEKAAYRAARPLHADRCTSLVDFFDYLNQLASIIGCQPSQLSMLFNPAKWNLLYYVIYGPFTTTQYRLRGPHTAKDVAIAQITEECHCPSAGHFYQAMITYVFMRPLLWTVSKIPGMGKYRPLF